MIDSSNVKDCGLRNRNLGFDMPKFGYTYELFKQDPVTSKRLGGAAGGTTGDRNIMSFGLNLFEWHVKGTQTILTPSITAVGLDIAQDNTATDGIEITPGGVLGRGKHCYTIGTDDPFFLRVKAKVTDGSGCNPFHIGFRKAEAYQAGYASYADYALVGIVGGDATPKIKTETEVAGGGTTTTDSTTTWPDTETHELKVVVQKNGKVAYYRDGVLLTAPPAYTFTSGLVVIPTIFLIHGADVCEALELIEVECGPVQPLSKTRRIK